MKLLISSIVAVLVLIVSVFANDPAAQRKAAEAERKAAAAERKAADAERKAEAVRKAEIKSLKQEVQALQSQKTTTAKEYGDKVRAINAKQDVIRAKERQ
jgi:ABC-type protease/lipase transport system fused ATPase/permease subunit